jgi:hypothetical protein
MKSASSFLPSLLLLWNAKVEYGEAFVYQTSGRQVHRMTAIQSNARLVQDMEASPKRRSALNQLVTGALTSMIIPTGAHAEESMFAPKFIQEYPDFTQTTEGWSFKDVKAGNGDSPKQGDRVVFEWSGYTVGYFARPFEARGYVSLKLCRRSV